MSSSFCLLLAAVAILPAIVTGKQNDLEAARGFKTEQMIKTSQPED